MRQLKRNIIFALIVSFNCQASSFDYVDVNRYVGIKVNKHQQQANPLHTVITITMPPEITTVGQAINYILKDSGYVLAPYQSLKEETRILISRPLPRIHRKFQIQTIESIMKALIGDNYLLMVEPVKREINFLFRIGN